MTNMDVAFSNMAAIKFEDILNQIRSSSLNFRMNVTPFTAVIHLKKTITKDKSGNFLHQSTFVRELPYVPKVLYSEGPMFRTFQRVHHQG